MIKRELKGFCRSITICSVADGFGFIIEAFHSSTINSDFEVV